MDSDQEQSSPGVATSLFAEALALQLATADAVCALLQEQEDGYSPEDRRMHRDLIARHAQNLFAVGDLNRAKSHMPYLSAAIADLEDQ